MGNKKLHAKIDTLARNIQASQVEAERVAQQRHQFVVDALSVKPAKVTNATKRASR